MTGASVVTMPTLFSTSSRHLSSYLGAAHLDHMVEFLCLIGQGQLQALQLQPQLHEQADRCHLSRSGDHIVCRLTKIDIIIGMDDAVISLLPSQKLDRTVGDHFIGVQLREVPAPP